MKQRCEACALHHLVDDFSTRYYGILPRHNSGVLRIARARKFYYGRMVRLHEALQASGKWHRNMCRVARLSARGESAE